MFTPVKGLENQMRKYHRWISVVAALFLIVVGTTGVVLQVQRLMGGEEEQEREREAATESEAAPRVDPSVLLSRTLAAAQQRAPGRALVSIELLPGGDEPKGVVILAGDHARRIVVDARDGDVVEDRPYEAESLILRIHSGAIFGEPGVFLGIFWGLALVGLSLTGAWVYLDLYRRRRKSGNGGMFW